MTKTLNCNFIFGIWIDDFAGKFKRVKKTASIRSEIIKTYEIAQIHCFRLSDT